VTTHDLLVIGAGNAGMAAARVGREAGWSVALVEEDLIGGTCSNRGCVPKKVLVAACEVVDHARRAHGHGVAGDLRIDWAALQARRRAIIDPIPASMAESLARQGVEIVRGHGVFVAPREIEVGGRRLSGRKVIIATGSKPRPLGFPGAELVATSDEVLALDRVPRTAAFIGAGAIGMELAHVLVRAGCERVLQLEVGPRALSQADADVVAALVAYGSTRGIELRTHIAIERIERTGAGMAVHVAGERVVVERVFHGAGRVPQLDELALERAGLRLERGKVALGHDLRCLDDRDVAIVGDAAPGMPQFSPLATKLGTLVARNLVEDRSLVPDLSTVPSCTFSIPELAQVGLTEERARERGIDVRVVRTDGIPGWISGRTQHEEAAFAKVLVGRDDQIVGAHLFGHGAGMTIHLFAMAMRHRITATALADGDAAYPTFASDVQYMV
jgi:glutathione reductase (NADPH)